jgi:hypothetical protein
MAIVMMAIARIVCVSGAINPLMDGKMVYIIYIWDKW